MQQPKTDSAIGVVRRKLRRSGLAGAARVLDEQDERRGEMHGAESAQENKCVTPPVMRIRRCGDSPESDADRNQNKARQARCGSRSRKAADTHLRVRSNGNRDRGGHDQQKWAHKKQRGAASNPQRRAFPGR
jgi:hypothetical protein